MHVVMSTEITILIFCRGLCKMVITFHTLRAPRAEGDRDVPVFSLIHVEVTTYL